MPLSRLPTLLLLLVPLALIAYLARGAPAPAPAPPHTSSFLFPTSAVISLTDDNSTYFVSRPAAFGPLLPHAGLDAELAVLDDGQLACDDTPGWDPTAAVAPETAAPAPTVPLKGAREHADIESLQQAAALAGKTVLVARGGCGFLDKVLWTQRRGGVALIVGDYRRPGVGGGGAGALVTMYAKGTLVPRLPLSRARGAAPAAVASAGDRVWRRRADGNQATPAT